MSVVGPGTQGDRPPERRPTDTGQPGRFDPRSQDRSVIAIPLLEQIRDAKARNDATPIPVVIDLNLDYKLGRQAALEAALQLLLETAESKGQAGGAGAAGPRGRRAVPARPTPAGRHRRGGPSEHRSRPADLPHLA
jgi:hypothetical protein